MFMSLRWSIILKHVIHYMVPEAVRLRWLWLMARIRKDNFRSSIKLQLDTSSICAASDGCVIPCLQSLA